MRKFIAIAIDGPSGSGKSTLAKSLAKKFGFTYIDTGALYRAIGLFILRNGLSSKDKEAIIKKLPEISVSLEYIDGKSIPILNGEDVSQFIRTPEVSMYASDVSAIPEVRTFLLSLQKNIAANNNVVMDGRDIGTVIIPDAQIKIFLTAQNGDRAERRFQELVCKGQKVTLDEIKNQMLERDSNDSSRTIAPALPADDAIILDNTGFTCEQTLQKALDIINERGIMKCFAF